MSRPLALALALVLVLGVVAGCSATPDDERPRPPGSDARVEGLVARLREYVYATYEVEEVRSDAAVAKLRDARTSLAKAMEEAGLKEPDASLAGLMSELRGYFAREGSYVFVPVGTADGVLLARVTARREVLDRDIGGIRASYKVVVSDGAAIEDVESRRRERQGAPPARPVARAAGKTIYVDLGVARWLAREVVIPRGKATEALEKRDAAALSPVEEKDLLRHRALAPAISRGVEAVADTIAAEEELRLGALLALAPESPSPETLSRIERTATLAAIAAGEPRYHLASALSATIAAPGSPTAHGAADAVSAFSGRPLTTWTPDQLRARARSALK